MEGLRGVGEVHHDEDCRYPRSCSVSRVLCADKDSNADYLSTKQGESDLHSAMLSSGETSHRL